MRITSQYFPPSHTPHRAIPIPHPLSPTQYININININRKIKEPSVFICEKQTEDFGWMDGIQQVALPVLGILAAAAITFYAVSFAELREVGGSVLPFFSNLSSYSS